MFLFVGLQTLLLSAVTDRRNDKQGYLLSRLGRAKNGIVESSKEDVGIENRFIITIILIIHGGANRRKMSVLILQSPHSWGD